jgi:AraC-like DNA-binding protein
MPRDVLPLIRVSTLAPFAARVDAAGGDLEALLEEHSILREAITAPDEFAPAPAVYGFCERAAAVVGDPNLGVRIGLSQDMRSWPPLREAFAGSSSIVEFLTCFVQEIERFATSTRYALAINRPTCRLRQERSFTPREKPAQVDAMGAGIIVNLLRKALGDRWRPAELSVRLSDPHAVRVPELAGISFVQGDTNGIEFAFPSSWLICPLAFVPTQETIPVPGGETELPADPVAALRIALKTNLSDTELDLNRATRLTGLPRSTLQRVLKARGMTFRVLLDDVRHEMAVSELLKGDASVTEVAFSLGYTDPANFTRAFRRWTGVSPREFRKR